MILAWIALAFVGGVWAGSWVSISPVQALPLASAALLTACLTRGNVRSLLLLMGAVMLGMGRTPHVSGYTSSGDLGHYVGHITRVQGVVAAEPDVRDTGSNYSIAVRSIVAAGRSVPVSGLLHVHTARSVQLEYGDVVTVTGRLRAPRHTFTTGTQRGIQAEETFPRIINAGPAPTGWQGTIVAIRQSLESGINAWLPEPEAELLIAISLGSRSAALGNLSPVLVSTGLIHIIAISGVKVALVAGTFYQLVRRLGRRGPTLLAALCALLTYVLLTGATASGERSALMWSLVFLAGYLGRGTVALVSLSVVAAGMVAFDPALLADTGFLMSTTGTFSIVAFSSPLIRWFHLVPSPWKEAFCVSAAAQVGTLPVVINGFHAVALVSPLSNAVVLPLLPGLILVGFVLGSLGTLSQVAAPVSAFAYVLLHAVILVARWFAHWPGHLAVPTSSWPWSCLYYVGLSALAFWLLRKEGWAPARTWTGHAREFSLAALCGLASVSVVGFGPRSAHATQLVWLGTGQALLVRSHDTTILIDGSPKPNLLLQRLGDALPLTTHTINAIVVTNPAASNVGALNVVLQHYRVQEVLDVGAQYPTVAYADWRDRLLRHGTPVFALRTGARLSLPGVSLTALGPDALCASATDCSGLLRLVLPGRTYMLAGSAGPREQHEALFRPVDIRCDVLVAVNPAKLDGAFLRQAHPTTVFTFAHGANPATGGSTGSGNVMELYSGPA